jgi:hypothetical protein
MFRAISVLPMPAAALTLPWAAQFRDAIHVLPMIDNSEPL